MKTIVHLDREPTRRVTNDDSAMTRRSLDGRKKRGKEEARDRDGTRV